MRLASIARASCATTSAVSTPLKGPLCGRAVGASGSSSSATGSARSAGSARGAAAGSAARAARAAAQPAHEPRRRRVADRAFQHLLVRRDRVGEVFHQVAELADLGRRAARSRCASGRAWRPFRPRSPRCGGRAPRPGGPMSAVPRERSAICAPTSPRSRARPLIELTITSAVSTAMVTTEASMPVKPNDR